MREIEFRGKTGTDGRWIYGCLVYSGSIAPAIYFEAGRGEVKTMEWAYVNPATIGQYTGLKDKNGTKIYEGDIVKVLGGYCVVVYDAPLFCFSDNVFGFRFMNEKHPECYEVIGNIHDNPELIEKGE